MPVSRRKYDRTGNNPSPSAPVPVGNHQSKNSPVPRDRPVSAEVSKMTREIPLTQGKVALVDDEDYPELSKFKWCAMKRPTGNYYAVRQSPKDPVTHKSITIRMHAVIVGTPGGLETDHIDGDGLNNRRCNLRIVTSRQNHQNLHIPKSSKYPGVTWDKRASKWHAQIQVNDKRRHLGYYDDEETAARRYRIACDWQAIDL